MYGCKQNQRQRYSCWAYFKPLRRHRHHPTESQYEGDSLQGKLNSKTECLFQKLYKVNHIFVIGCCYELIHVKKITMFKILKRILAQIKSPLDQVPGFFDSLGRLILPLASFPITWVPSVHKIFPSLHPPSLSTHFDARTLNVSSSLVPVFYTIHAASLTRT